MGGGWVGCVRGKSTVKGAAGAAKEVGDVLVGGRAGDALEIELRGVDDSLADVAGAGTGGVCGGGPEGDGFWGHEVASGGVLGC